MKKLFVMVVLALVFIPAALWAAPQGENSSFQKFQQEVNNAYASYRIALFQTNKKNQTK